MENSKRHNTNDLFEFQVEKVVALNTSIEES